MSTKLVSLSMAILMVAVSATILRDSKLKAANCGSGTGGGWSTSCIARLQAQNPSPCSTTQNGSCSTFCSANHPSSQCSSAFSYKLYTGADVYNVFDDGSRNFRSCSVDCYTTSTCFPDQDLFHACGLLGVSCYPDVNFNCAVCHVTVGGITQVGSNEEGGCG